MYVYSYQESYFTTFGVSSQIKSDEEILRDSGYEFHLDLDVLLKNSETTRLAERNKRRGITRIPRPQNAWIIYRRNKSVALKQELERKNQKSKDLSKDIAKMWTNEPKYVRELFEALSRLSERKHIEIYGDYKYKPNRSESSKKSSKSKSPKSSKPSKSKTSDSEPKLPESKSPESKSPELKTLELNYLQESNSPESKSSKSKPSESKPSESKSSEFKSSEFKSSELKIKDLLVESKSFERECNSPPEIKIEQSTLFNKCLHHPIATC